MQQVKDAQAMLREETEQGERPNTPKPPLGTVVCRITDTLSPSAPSQPSMLGHIRQKSWTCPPSPPPKKSQAPKRSFQHTVHIVKE